MRALHRPGPPDRSRFPTPRPASTWVDQAVECPVVERPYTVSARRTESGTGKPDRDRQRRLGLARGLAPVSGDVEPFTVCPSVRRIEIRPADTHSRNGARSQAECDLEPA
jgi:hypothetical protein